MASSRNNRTTPSASRNITNIVDKYASPALGSSPLEYSRRSYDPILSGHGHGDVSTSSLPSPSPSPYPLSDSRRANLHPSNSTHSGYLDRAQLFGRTPIPIQHNARRARSSRISSIRKRSSRTPTGEWAEAGLPEPPIEDRSVSLQTASGLICTPNGITTLDVGEDTPGRFSPSAQSPTSRKTSPAEDALREQFVKGRVKLARNLTSRPDPNGKSKWAGSIECTHREGDLSPKTPTTVSGGEEEGEDEEEEFGYVDPASVRDVLARVKAREAGGRTKSLFDGGQRAKSGDGPKDSYFDVDVPRRSKNALLTDISNADMALPKLADRNVRSLVKPPSMKTTSRRKRPSPVSNRARLSFSPIFTAMDVAPRPTRQDLTITPTPIRLSLNPITTTILHPPLSPSHRSGLTFSQATAIIYSCMAMTASHLALLGLGGDIAATDLIVGLYRAFLLGLAVCVALQLMLSIGMRRWWQA